MRGPHRRLLKACSVCSCGVTWAQGVPLPVLPGHSQSPQIALLVSVYFPPHEVTRSEGAEGGHSGQVAKEGPSGEGDP